MTHQFKCLSCGARYLDQQQDGTLYFHACGPMPPNKDGVQIERPDKRDENIAVNQLGRVMGIKTEGQGVECLTDAKLEQPIWLTQLQAKAAKEEQS